MSARVNTKTKSMEVPSILNWISPPQSRPEGYATLQELAQYCGISTSGIEQRISKAQRACEARGEPGPHSVRISHREGSAHKWLYPCPEMATAQQGGGGQK